MQKYKIGDVLYNKEKNLKLVIDKIEKTKKGYLARLFTIGRNSEERWRTYYFDKLDEKCVRIFKSGNIPELLFEVKRGK